MDISYHQKKRKVLAQVVSAIKSYRTSRKLPCATHHLHSHIPPFLSTTIINKTHAEAKPSGDGQRGNHSWCIDHDSHGVENYTIHIRPKLFTCQATWGLRRKLYSIGTGWPTSDIVENLFLTLILTFVKKKVTFYRVLLDSNN